MTLTPLDSTAPSVIRPDRERWFRGPGGVTRRLVALLDADPDFGRRLSPDEREVASRQVVVSVQRIHRGRWRADPDPVRRPLAYVVLSGALIRGWRVEDRWSTELVGPEDVMQPWDEPEPPEGVSVETEWTALEPVELAVLDHRFAAAAGRWPGLLEELVGRALRRSRLLATLLSVSGIRRLDDRLLVLLLLLADRWGVVTPEGILLRLRLTHETIARLAGAQRPSVSTAIARLSRAGIIERRGRQLIIPHELPAEVALEVQRRRAA
jgi:CRP/FNR family cyclic AMP-dependent transcriptional regulator